MSDDSTTDRPEPPDGFVPVTGADASAGTSGTYEGTGATNDGAAVTDDGVMAAGDGTSPPPPPAKRRGFFRRHLALTSLLVIFVLLVGSAGGFVWYLNHELGNIPTFQSTVIKPRTDVNNNVIPESDSPLNILVLGADNGNDTQTVAEDLQDGTWTRGAHRSDTIILVHIPKDRKSAQIISIPRDSWVPVPTFPGDIDGKAKINAAFSWGGPDLAIRTIQNFTGLHIDHVAMIDWNGFKGLTDALGGVRVYIPQTVYDSAQHVTWQQGWQTLDGDKALQYVRTRHGLPNGDFDRIARQQNFLRTIMDSMLSTSTFFNPIKLARVIGTLSSFVEVDNTWSTSDIRNLAISSRDLRAGNVQFTTAPFGSYGTIGGQSVVNLDAAKCKVLFRDFDHGNLTSYLKANPGSSLPGSQSVK